MVSTFGRTQAAAIKRGFKDDIETHILISGKITIWGKYNFDFKIVLPIYWNTLYAYFDIRKFVIFMYVVHIVLFRKFFGSNIGRNICRQLWISCNNSWLFCTALWHFDYRLSGTGVHSQTSE